MPKFELIEDKKPHQLVADDHIMHQDRFWRVIENHSILGYPTHTRRMLMIVPEQRIVPQSFKFLEITSEARIAAYRKTE